MKVMGKKSCTYRQGVIVALNGTKARVQFINESACASCHAKAACGMGDTKLYEIDALVAEGEDLHVGDHVFVSVRNDQGYLAIFLGYGLPFLLLMLGLVLFNLLGFSELQMALSMLGTLVVYYLMLYWFRSRLSRRFSFTITSERK